MQRFDSNWISSLSYAPRRHSLKQPFDISTFKLNYIPRQVEQRSYTLHFFLFFNRRSIQIGSYRRLPLETSFFRPKSATIIAKSCFPVLKPYSQHKGQQLPAENTGRKLLNVSSALWSQNAFSLVQSLCHKAILHVTHSKYEFTRPKAQPETSHWNMRNLLSNTFHWFFFWNKINWRFWRFHLKNRFNDIAWNR